MQDEFRQWVKEYCWPVSNAINSRLPAKAQELLELAEANTPDLAEQPIEWEGYGVAVIWHQYIWDRTFAPEEKRSALFEERLAQLLVPRTTHFGEQERLKVLLCIRLNAEVHGCSCISRQEIIELLNRIEVGYENLLLWHHISPWALKHHDEELAARAVEVLLADKRVAHQDAAYRRTVLLHAMVAGSATAEMISRYLEFRADQGVWGEFIDMILPAAEELGLIDDDLHKRIAEIKAEIEASGSESRE